MFRKGHARPDFIGVGMQKAGTAFLYNCLNELSGFRMPAIKEIHHFDRYNNNQGNRRFVRGVARQFGKVKKRDSYLVDIFQQLDPQEWCDRKSITLANRTLKADIVTLQFMKMLSLYLVNGGRDKDYLRLFEPYHDHVTGDITPGYSILDIEQIKRVKNLLPDARIILCVRDPIARLWSQINMLNRRAFINQSKGKITSADAQMFDNELSLKSVKEYISQEKVTNRSFTLRTYQRWLDIYGSDNMLVIHFEDLTQKTELVLDKVSMFFDQAPTIPKSIPGNRKENKVKTTLDFERRAVLEKFLGDELANYEEIFQQHKDRV